MTDDEPEVPIVCPECETRSTVPLATVAAAVERHNEQVHDGEEVASVDPELADQLADIVAEDLDLL